LLDAFARDIPGDGRVVGFARDLVDLVDIDDPALRALDVVIGGLQVRVVASAMVNGTSIIRASV